MSVGPPWIKAGYGWLSRETRRGLTVGFLRAVLIAYSVVLVSATIAAGVGFRQLLRHRRRLGSARLVAVSLSSLLGLLLLEASAGAYRVWTDRPPPIPPVPSFEVVPVPNDRAKPGELVLLVLGESSAKGEPYDPFISVGQIVAWQLEQALPGRSVKVEMAAHPGWPLLPMIEALGKQTRRPDAVIVYAGHNEFQARWAWSRTVRHYDDDWLAPRSRNETIERFASWTPLGRMVRKAIENQYLDSPPPMQVTRDVVDWPTCSTDERAAVRLQFERQLEAIVGWCERAGAIPILIVPPGNDAGFEPDRSVLAPSTLKPEREAIATQFLGAKLREGADPVRAAEVYRSLIDRQPGFAEAHFRLARLLQSEGQTAEARRHYALARDLDGLPMRCPSDFQQSYRNVASRHDVVLVDGLAAIEAVSPSGLLDDAMFHDAQHPSLKSYVAIAREVFRRLVAREAFGIKKDRLIPEIDLEDCLSHFGFDRAAWLWLCNRSAIFWKGVAYIRYDPTERLAQAARYREAARAIENGKTISEVNIPGVGR